MGITVRASLFYGYIEPQPDEDEDEDEPWQTDDDEEDETPWDKAHTKESHGCTVSICGYDTELRSFLAVEESLHAVYPEEVQLLDLSELAVQHLNSTWDLQLRQAAQTFGIDLTGLQVGWHLVCLYF